MGANLGVGLAERHPDWEITAFDNLKRSVALATQKDMLRHKWAGVRIVGVSTSGNGHFKVGEQMRVEALVDLPGLVPNDVTVQLYAGRISARGEIEEPCAINMQHQKEMAPGRHLFTGRLDCKVSGRQGFAIRILPGGEDLAPGRGAVQTHMPHSGQTQRVDRRPLPVMRWTRFGSP